MFNNLSTLDTLARLKAEFHNDNFDTTAVWLLSGNSAKEMRREIMQILTGKKLPLSKCGFTAVCEAVKDSFMQKQMQTA